jgi:hypothetical protein
VRRICGEPLAFNLVNLVSHIAFAVTGLCQIALSRSPESINKQDYSPVQEADTPQAKNHGRQAGTCSCTALEWAGSRHKASFDLDDLTHSLLTTRHKPRFIQITVIPPVQWYFACFVGVRYNNNILVRGTEVNGMALWALDCSVMG